jgi:hypothetical protein
MTLRNYLLNKQLKRSDFMNSITVEKLVYKNFGECLKLSNGIVEAFITIDIGPRIIRYGLIGGENYLLEDIERSTEVTNKAMEAVFGEGSKWFIYGGHRLWLSPEDMPLTYYPDNECVVWNEIPGGVELIPPAQRVNDFQYRIEVIMSKNMPKISIKHYATNIGDSTKKRSMWALTVLSKNGLEVIPQPIHDTGLLANRVLSLWSFSDMSDDRVYWGKKYISLRQDTSITSAFKLGISNMRGWAAYFNHGGMFVKKYENNPNGNYPDFGTSFETYTNDKIMEMETLGELVDITPGSTAYHGEEWSLFSNVERPEARDEITIDTLVKLYIEK